MPKKVDDIRKAILREHPDVGEKASWAMAYAAYNKMQAKTAAEEAFEKVAGPAALSIEQFARKVDHLVRAMRGENAKTLLAKHRMGQRVLRGSKLMENAEDAVPYELISRPGKDWK